MHPKRLAHYAAILKEIGDSLLDPLSGERIPIGPKGVGSFTMSEAHATKFDELIDKLQQEEGWKSKFSKRYLRNKIQDILYESRNPGENCESLLKKLLREYEEYPVERQEFIPLTGVKMEMEELELGQVVLVNMEGTRGQELTELFRSIIFQTAHTAGYQEVHFQQTDENYLSKIRGKVCACIKVLAEPERAEEIAIEEARKVVDLLRYSAPSVYQWGETAIGLQGEVGEETRATVGIATDKQQCNHCGTLIFRPFELTSSTLEEMKRIGVFELADMQKKEEPTKFEQDILRSVHWFASAQVQLEKHNAMLNLVTSLEALLNKGKDPITVAIAEGTAILIGKTLERRKDIKKKIRKFYDTRSDFTHGRDSGVSNSDLRFLIHIAGTLIMKMIERRSEFNSRDELVAWIEDEKLKGGIPALAE